MRETSPRRAIRWLITAVIVAVACCVPCPSQGQNPRTSEQRPRVGLVLSGGGARGAAHVGVLKVLEELRVPVDYIVGTSMGAAVGGLYASGLSAETIEQRFESVDWADLLSDRPPRKNISFRRKQDDQQALFRLEMGVTRHGIVLPGGLMAGQKLSFLLRTMSLHTAGVEHFDKLPIPFRAVATDLQNGEMVVLERGDLVEAIRASMAVPGALTPVDLDGRVLIDGGIVRNLPVDVVKSLGAERIIAVDVSTPIKDLEGERSVVGVAVQTLLVLTDKNIRDQISLLVKDDVLISPELDDFPASGFARIDEAMRIGETAARLNASKLARLSVSEEEFEAYLARRRESGRSAGERVTIDSIEVAPGSRVNPKIITRRIDTRPGQALDLTELQSDLERVYRIGEFQQVDFRLIREPDHNRLVIDAEDKSWGPRYVRFGLALEADFKGEGDFTVLANYRQTQLNRLGAEWKNIVKIGDTNSLFTEFYQPLDLSGLWFIAPQVELLRGVSQSFDGTRNLGLGFSRGVLGRLDVGLQFRKYGELRIGIERGRFDTEDRTGTLFKPVVADLGRLRAKLTVDQLDNASFPRRGTFARINYLRSRENLGADEEYEALSMLLIQAVSFRRHTLVGQLRGGTDLGTNLPPYSRFPLGGFLKLSGLKPGELQGDVLGHFSLTYYRQVGRLPGPLGGGVYLGGALEVGNVWQDVSDAELADLRPAGLIFGGADTVLGPVYLGVGRTDQGESSLYLFLGQLF